MISSFSVGARFEILDEASPALRKILAEVRDLTATFRTAASFGVFGHTTSK